MRKKWVLLCLTLFMLLVIFTPTTHVKAACGLGDIICEGKQAISDLLTELLGPLKLWFEYTVWSGLYGFLYNLLRSTASLLWTLAKALLSVGVAIGVIADWISANFFQPLLSSNIGIFRNMASMMFFIALAVLGCTYVIASLIRVNVVSPRSMFLWYLAAALFFQLGPSLYASLNDLRQSLQSYFYAVSLDALGGQTPFNQLASGDSSRGDATFGMVTPCSNFSLYLPSAGGAFNGMDVGLAFLQSDGRDVLLGGSSCVSALPVTDIPRRWTGANGFFDALQAPPAWTPPTFPQTIDPVRQTMQKSVEHALAGNYRIVQATPLLWYGVIEQLVALCLIVAQGLTFLSFGCAVMFGFFRRTEGVAWAVFDNWLALLVQTIIIGIVQALVVAIYLSAAASGSPLATLGVSVVSALFMGILLWSGVKAIWNAFNRLFEAFGSVTGGTVISTGQAAQSGLAATAAVATGGAALVGSAVGGMSALAGGATFSQAAGVALGGNRALDGAMFQLARLPGVRDTELGELANQFSEGSATRRVGETVLGVIPGGTALSRLGGAALGAQLLTDRNPDNAELRLDERGNVYEAAPLLNPGVTRAAKTMLRGVNWEHTSPVGSEGALREADGTPLTSGAVQRGQREVAQTVPGPYGASFTPTQPDGDTATTTMRAVDNGEGVADEIQENALRQAVGAGDRHKESGAEPAARGEANKDSAAGSGSRLEGAANRLENAASSLATAGEGLARSGGDLGRSVQQAETNRRMEQVEGHMTLNGAGSVNTLMGDVINTLAAQNARTGQVGADANSTSSAMAGALGLAPAVNPDTGRAVPAVERGIGRFATFADQALDMGLNGQQAVSIANEVKASPEGRLSDATRSSLIEGQRSTGHSWSDSVSSVRNLENAARSLPEAVSVHGVLPATPHEPLPLRPLEPEPPPAREPLVFTAASTDQAETTEPTAGPYARLRAAANR